MLIKILKRKSVSRNPTTTIFVFFYIISRLYPHAHTRYSWILYLRTCLLQKCIGNPKTGTRSTFLVIDRHAQSGEKLESPQLVFPAEVEHISTLPSRSGSHTVNKCHFCASHCDSAVYNGPSDSAAQRPSAQEDHDVLYRKDNVGQEKSFLWP